MLNSYLVLLFADFLSLFLTLFIQPIHKLECIDAGQHQKYWGMFDNNNDKKRNGEVGGALDEDDFAVLMARRRSKRREYGPWYRILCQTLFLSSIISYYPCSSSLSIYPFTLQVELCRGQPQPQLLKEPEEQEWHRVELPQREVVVRERELKRLKRSAVFARVNSLCRVMVVSIL